MTREDRPDSARATSGDATTPEEAVRRVLDLVLETLDADKAEGIVVIPLAGKTSIADYMVIASGRSTRQVAAMAENLAQEIKGKLGRQAGLEGLRQADWVLLDAGDVIVHLFRPEIRAFYNLEKMWGAPAPREGDDQAHAVA